MVKSDTKKVKPEVKITLDKERTLRFDLNAMVEFEEVTGKSLLSGKFKSGKMTPRDLRVMLWACLMHEDESLTEKQVGSWVTVHNMKEISDKLNEAFEVAMPESEAKEEAPLVGKPPLG